MGQLKSVACGIIYAIDDTFVRGRSIVRVPASKRPELIFYIWSLKKSLKSIYLGDEFILIWQNEWGVYLDVFMLYLYFQ